MMRTLPLPLILVMALAACQREHPASASSPAQPSSAAARRPANPMASSGPARLDGYGPLSFGMTAAEMKQAWVGTLRGAPARGNICYELVPDGSTGQGPLAFMVEADKLVRYDVHANADVAPGGGRRGMTADDIRRRYAGLVQEIPAASGRAGRALRVRSPHPAGGVLLFETSASGEVTGWRVGQAPQVDYADGCH
jgi:hypothetical protein